MLILNGVAGPLVEPVTVIGTPVAATVPCRSLNDPLVMTPLLLIVQLTVARSTGAPVIVQGPASPATKPDPETVKVVPGAAGGPGIAGEALEGEIEMKGRALTDGGSREYAAANAVTNSRTE